MNRRSVVIAAAVIAVAAFAAAAALYDRFGTPAPAVRGDALVRAHSPVMGPADAPVTIVEFFDPSCESCRAFYPILKRIMAQYPEDVRLVLRYTAFHEGSDEAVRILETARTQGKFEDVLYVLLSQQSEWAIDGAPNLARAWELAGIAGLDVARAKGEANAPEIDRVLEQDMADVAANKVERTPTFFVNGRPLQDFGAEQLLMLVQDEVKRVKSGS